MFVDIGGVGYVDKVTHGLLGDDIHYTRDGIGAVGSRTATAHHLDAVNHRRRHLFQAIDRGHGREYRTRVHQYLGVLTLQTIDAQVGLTAVAAGVIHPQARLKTQRVGNARHGGGLKQLRRQHIDNRGCLLTLGRVAVGGHYDIIDEFCLLADDGFEFDGFVFL